MRGQRGRPRRRPERLYADRAHDSRQRRKDLRARHIAPALARRGAEHGSGLGVHRWVVERTLSWLHSFADCGCATSGVPTSMRPSCPSAVPSSASDVYHLFVRGSKFEEAQYETTAQLEPSGRVTSTYFVGAVRQ